MKKHFYVYALIDPRKGKGKGGVFYIGKGTWIKSGSAERNQVHLRQSIAGIHYNPYLQNKIKKIHKKGLVYGVEFLFSTYDEQECLDKEIFYIAFFGRKSLCNLTDGGDGVSGLIRTEIHKAKISAALMGNTNGTGRAPGFSASGETKAKMSAASKGRPAHNKGRLPKGHGAKISAYLKGKQSRSFGKKWSQESRDNLSSVTRGVPKSEEHKAKLRKPKTKEARDNMRTGQQARRTRERAAKLEVLIAA